MKCMEKLVLRQLLSHVNDLLDPCQFAYKKERSTEDAILLFLDKIYKHLDTPRNFVRILFVDFSSAFNTLQPHLLIQKLSNMKVSVELQRWIFNFLFSRPQFVKINDTLSSTITLNTGAPQGCVLSPVLYTIYTNDCTSVFEHVSVIKFADDTSIFGLISNDESDYFKQVSLFTDWCDDNYLLLNVSKTKETFIDFRITAPLIIKDQEIKVVSSYKYLGITLDNKLSWHPHVQTVYKKGNQNILSL